MEKSNSSSLHITTPSGIILPAESLLIIDVDVTQLFEGESLDWKYCVDNAPWQHNEACEFLLYTWRDDSEVYFVEKIREMTEYGCSEDLIALVQMARKRHAAWLMLHA
jgi:hypothetical protein